MFKRSLSVTFARSWPVRRQNVSLSNDQFTHWTMRLCKHAAPAAAAAAAAAIVTWQRAGVAKQRS